MDGAPSDIKYINRKYYSRSLIEGIVVLSAFIPILIGSGGNAGAQSSTVVIRGLAIGEIEVRHAFRILLRERDCLTNCVSPNLTIADPQRV